MPVYVISRSNEGECFEVCKWTLDLASMEYQPGDMLGFAARLDHARFLIPPGCVNVGRMEGDRPAVQEVWL